MLPCEMVAASGTELGLPPRVCDILISISPHLYLDIKHGLFVVDTDNPESLDVQNLASRICFPSRPERVSWIMDVNNSGNSLRTTRHLCSTPTTIKTENTESGTSTDEKAHDASSLLNIPVELRLRILSELLRCPSLLCLTPVSQDRDPEDSDAREEDIRWVPTWRLSAQVLAVCRQLNEEGSSILYANHVCMHFCERSVTILDVHLTEEVMANMFSDIDHDEIVPKAVRRRNDSTETTACRCPSLKDHIKNRMTILRRFKKLTCTIEGGAPPQNTKACLMLRAAGAHKYQQITIKNNFANRTTQNRPTRWYSGPVWLKYLRCDEVKFEGRHHDPPWANQIAKLLRSSSPSPNLLHLFLSMQDVADNVLEEGFDTLVEVLGKNNWKSAEGRDLNYLYQADGQQYEEECVPVLERAEAKLKQQLAKVTHARMALKDLYL